MAKRRYTTAAEDRAFIASALAGANKDWKIGDEAQTFKGVHTARVERIDGDIIYLSDGTSGHRSRMRLPKGS